MTEITIASGETRTGLTLRYQSALVYGTASQTTLNDQGYLYVYSGGVASDTAVNAGGRVMLSGGLLKNTVLSGSLVGDVHEALLHMYGGTQSNTTIYNCGSMMVYAGARANGVQIYSGGLMRVGSGVTSGVASGAVVHSGGRMDISGGLALGNEIKEGGFMLISQGAARGTTIFWGGQVNMVAGSAYNTLVSGYGQMNISGGSADWVTIREGDVTITGGTANDVRVDSYGTLDVSGGKVYSAAVSAGAYLKIYNGGYVYGGIVSGLNADARVYSGGMANVTSLCSSGRMAVSSGGVISLMKLYATAHLKLTHFRDRLVPSMRSSEIQVMLSVLWSAVR